MWITPLFMAMLVKILDKLHVDTAQLVITSPPYYNAKPEYSEYLDYQDYLEFLRVVFSKTHRIPFRWAFFDSQRVACIDKTYIPKHIK